MSTHSKDVGSKGIRVCFSRGSSMGNGGQSVGYHITPTSGKGSEGRGKLRGTVLIATKMFLKLKMGLSLH